MGFEPHSLCQCFQLFGPESRVHSLVQSFSSHKGGTCTERGEIDLYTRGGGVKERGRPAHRRERGTYPLSGLLHTKGDDREGGNPVHSREGGITTEGAPAHKEGREGGESPVHRRERGNYPLRGILHTKGDDRERETCTQKREGELPTEGDPAHKGGR